MLMISTLGAAACPMRNYKKSAVFSLPHRTLTWKSSAVTPGMELAPASTFFAMAAMWPYLHQEEGMTCPDHNPHGGLREDSGGT